MRFMVIVRDASNMSKDLVGTTPSVEVKTEPHRSQKRKAHPAIRPVHYQWRGLSAVFDLSFQHPHEASMLRDCDRRKTRTSVATFQMRRVTASAQTPPRCEVSWTKNIGRLQPALGKPGSQTAVRQRSVGRPSRAEIGRQNA